MLSEIKIAFTHLNNDPQGKRKRNFILLFLLIFIGLLFWNRSQITRINTDQIEVFFEESQLLFIKNLSPYDENVSQYISNRIVEENWDVEISEYSFELPLWQLIYYLPFSFLPNPWGISVFLAVSQISVIVALYLILFQLNKDKLTSLDYFIPPIIFFSVFTQENIYSGNLASIMFLFIICSIYFSSQKKNIVAGIFLGLAIFSVVQIPIIVLSLIIVAFKNKHVVKITWSIITLLIITLFLIIFDRNWLLGWLKNLFLTPQTVPFLSYPDALAEKMQIGPTIFLSIISFLLVIWIFLEFWRFHPVSVLSTYWLLSISTIINLLLILQQGKYAAFYLILPFIFILTVWRNKLKGNAVISTIIASAVIAPIYLTASVFYPDIINSRVENIYFTIIVLLIVLNLYWLKRWVFNPYEVDKNFLKTL